MPSNTSVVVNGYEVKNPIARMLIIAIAVLFTFATCFGLFMLLLSFVPLLLVIAIVTIVGLVPLHFVLVASGRRGFYTYENNTHTWDTSGAFKRK